MKDQWQNRIIRMGEESPDQLLASPRNWRVHPKHQQDALSGVLSEVGWVQQVLVNQRTGHVVDGHLRVALALRQSEPLVPVLYVDLSEEEEALILATLDPISALATTDKEQLDSLLREVSTGDSALQAMLAELAERARIGVELIVPEPAIQKAPSLRAACFIEIYCSATDLDEFRPILDDWGDRNGVTINIS